MTTMTDIEGAIAEALAEGDIKMDPSRFVSLLRQAVQAVRGTRVTSKPASQLTSAEVTELRRGGLAPTADFGAYERVRATTAAEMAALLSRALSTAEAAERLELDPSRIRQLLSERRLLAVRNGAEWQILDVQFVDGSLVPNIGQVLAALPDGMPPLVSATWLTSPEPDLDIRGQVVSPVEWLSAGGDPERVSALAADL